MPVKNIVIAASLIFIVVLVAFVSTALGSEFYLFVPGGRRSAFVPPPSSPWLILFLMIIVVGVFAFSRRYAAILLAVLPALALLGPMVGALFEWTPGAGHWFLTLSLFAAAAYVWTNECLNED